jgi:hypothetical protein
MGIPACSLYWVQLKIYFLNREYRDIREKNFFYQIAGMDIRLGEPSRGATGYRCSR